MLESKIRVWLSTRCQIWFGGRLYKYQLSRRSNRWYTFSLFYTKPCLPEVRRKLAYQRSDESLLTRGPTKACLLEVRRKLACQRTDGSLLCAQPDTLKLIAIVRTRFSSSTHISITHTYTDYITQTHIQERFNPCKDFLIQKWISKNFTIHSCKDFDSPCIFWYKLLFLLIYEGHSTDKGNFVEKGEIIFLFRIFLPLNCLELVLSKNYFNLAKTFVLRLFKITVNQT